MVGGGMNAIGRGGSGFRAARPRVGASDLPPCSLPFLCVQARCSGRCRRCAPTLPPTPPCWRCSRCWPPSRCRWALAGYALKSVAYSGAPSTAAGQATAAAGTLHLPCARHRLQGTGCHRTDIFAHLCLYTAECALLLHGGDAGRVVLAPLCAGSQPLHSLHLTHPVSRWQGSVWSSQRGMS